MDHDLEEGPAAVPGGRCGGDDAKLGAELAVQTGSALAARELRLVRTVLRKAGADAALSELTEHMRDITATS